MTTTSLSPPHVEAPFAWTPDRPMLTAEWRNLAMLNYEVDPRVLTPYLPAGTELDDWNGASYASIVGFQFHRARFLGLAVPLHTNFVEVNLRFYVRRRAAEGWRRGVVFIRELAPRRAVALVANLLYGERYVTVPMSHRIEQGENGVPRRVEYAWRRRGRHGLVAVETDGPARALEPGTHEHYIAEHYWGYSALRRGRTKEYLVAHPPWHASPATSATLQCDAAALYGKPLAEFLSEPPASAFWADGSAVRVYRGVRIAVR
jgi:uncharacterized protein